MLTLCLHGNNSTLRLTYTTAVKSYSKSMNGHRLKADLSIITSIRLYLSFLSREHQIKDQEDAEGIKVKDKEDRTPVTQTPLPLWSFVWSGLRVLSTGDVTSYSISYSRG